MRCVSFDLAAAGDKEATSSESVADLFERIKGSQAFAQTWADENVESKKCSAVESCMAEEKAKGKVMNEEVAAATLEVLALDLKETTADQLKKVQPNEDRSTLSGALRGHDTFQDATHHLWQLLCHLRLAPEGADRKIVPNHFLTRGRVTKGIQKWQNLLRHQLAQENALQCKTVAKKRAERVLG